MASSGERNEIRNMKGVRERKKSGAWERGMGEMKRERKKSEVGRGKSTSRTGQAIVQGNVEVLA